MRALVALGVAAVVLTAGTGSAATLGVDGGPLGAGDAAVSSCDTGGLSLAWATTAGKVSTVTVGGLADPACDGATVEVTVMGGGTRIATATPATVPVDGDALDGEVALTVPALPSPDAVDGARILVRGP